MSLWKEKIKSAEKTCIKQDGKRKIHYTFSDGCEMVEEYKLISYELIVRKHKRRTITGAETKWDFEVGVDLTPKVLNSDGFIENINNPLLTRGDSLEYFEWRIRNFPHPLSICIVSIEDNLIVVKTTNKKYYKKLDIPDMKRLGVVLDPSKLAYSHANNTLIIKYAKPKEVLEMELEIRKELKKLTKNKDGDVEMCSPS